VVLGPEYFFPVAGTPLNFWLSGPGGNVLVRQREMRLPAAIHRREIEREQ